MVVTLTHRRPEELPIDRGTSKAVVRTACPGLPERLTRALGGTREPAVGQRLASAREVLAVLDGGALQRAETSLPVPKARSLPPTVYELPLYGGGAAALLLHGSSSTRSPRPTSSRSASPGCRWWRSGSARA